MDPDNPHWRGPPPLASVASTIYRHVVGVDLGQTGTLRRLQSCAKLAVIFRLVIWSGCRLRLCTRPLFRM